MLGTVVGVLVALISLVLVRYFPGLEGAMVSPLPCLDWIFGFALFISLLPWLWMVVLAARPRKQPGVDVVLCRWRHDMVLRLLFALTVLASFAGLLVSVTASSAIQLVFLAPCIGVILDLVRMSHTRLMDGRSVEGMGNWILSAMRRAAARKKDIREQIDGMDTLFSLVADLMRRGDLRPLKILASTIAEGSDVWIRAIASQSLFRQGLEGDESLLDRYTVAEVMVAKRLSWVTKVAVETGCPPIVEEAVRLYGRVFLVFNAHQESLGFVILTSLSQALQGSESGADRFEVTAVLSEVAKSLIDRSLQRGVSEKSAIVKVLSLLEFHVKEIFRKDHSVSVALLMQPFAEIGQLLGGVRYQPLPDRESVLAELKRLLTQFAAIEAVSARMDVEGTDTTASFHEDLPFTKPISP